MATYVNNLRLKEITTGDEDGTWGTSTNTNLELITDGFSYGTKEMAADANETFTMPDATADDTRSFYLKITSAVSLTATRTITLGPNTVSKVWMIENATSGSQSISISQGSGANVTVPNGSKVMIVTDGAGAGAAVFNANPTEVGGTVTSVGGTGTVNGITLTGTVTSSGNLTLGGTLSNVNLTSQVTGTLPVANGGTGVTSSTGTGAVVLSTSPTFTTPNLGTPSAATLTNATGLPIVAGTTGTLSVARGGTGSTTASGALTNLGLTATATELNYTDGVTSNIQTQLNAKGVGSVTSVGGTGTVNGITLSGTVTSSGNLTLGGSVSINNSNWSGTDLSLANGGTGASLVDPNADRIFFWDDSAGATTFLTVGSGLQISGTTLSSTDAGGTVTSVAVSGGTTGLTTSGGPVTTSGTITLAGTLAVANGGTGSTTAAGALTNLGLTATATELNYTDGVTSAIQTQLNAKQATITGGATTITSSNLTTSRALVSDGSGKVAVSAVTSTEVGYLDGVTSAIQTQLNAKGVGSVTSVGGTGTVQGLTLSGTVTSSGNLTLGGALSNINLTSQVTGTLPVANGGTGITSLGSGVATFLGTPSSANLAAAVTGETGTGALVFATSPTLVTPVLGTPTSGTLSNCTVDGTNAVGFKNIPQNSKSAAYTLVLADAGKHILHPSADTTARTFTIPANSSVAFPIGTAITFINQNSAGVVTIAITSDTMRLSPAGTTGSRTLAANGSATCIKITSTEWIISGSGLT